MQKSVSVLTGLAGSGKSSTLRVVVDIVQQEAGRESLGRFPRASKEAGHVFKINGLVIGIVGAGDSEAQIRRRFEWLLQFDCDIIICASRPSEIMIKRTEKLIADHFGEDATLHWIQKYAAALEALEETENQLSAWQLLESYASLLGLTIPPSYSPLRTQLS